MIAGVRGTIVALEPAAVVVDLHGFRVRVHTSARTLAAIGGVGEQVELTTHLIVREDAITLYGFPEPSELQMFQLLLSVSGVGPRVALSLLSFGESSMLYDAISNEDAAFLSKVPGIGKKTAEQIIFQLRRKLPTFEPSAAGAPAASPDREAVAALEALGYSMVEARNALAAVEERDGMSVEDRVYNALQRLAQR